MQKLSLKAKVLLSMIPFLVGMAVISTVGIKDMAEIESSLDRMVNVYGKRNQMGADAIRAIGNLQAAQRNFIRSTNKAQQEKYLKLEDENLAQANKLISDYIAFAGEYAKAHLPEAQDKLKQWTEIDKQVRALVASNQIDAARELNATKGDALEEDFRKILDGCYESSRNKMGEEAEKGFKTYSFSRWSLWLTTLIASIFGLGLTTYIVSKVSKEVARIIAALEGNTDNLNRASQEMARSSQQVSQAATEQAASLEQTAASIEEISAMVKKNAEGSVTAQEISQQSMNGATQGKQAVDEMIQAIEEISRSNSAIGQQVEASNHEMAEIVKLITEIGNKTKVINDIVFQTRLLSFNASVEAARAGEHGKGFAVVAEEVGNLAQMSGNASKEIFAMLEDSISKVKQIADSTKTNVGQLMEKSREKVDAGTVIAKRCSDVLGEIVTAADSVTQRVAEISTASQEQAKGIQEINKAVAQLDSVTQTNASSSNESAEAASHLSVEARELRNSVNELVQVILGASAGVKAEVVRLEPKGSVHQDDKQHEKSAA
jgi:methyl-accepting chemotaxis protein